MQHHPHDRADDDEQHKRHRYAKQFAARQALQRLESFRATTVPCTPPRNIGTAITASAATGHDQCQSVNAIENSTPVSARNRSERRRGVGDEGAFAFLAGLGSGRFRFAAAGHDEIGARELHEQSSETIFRFNSLFLDWP